MNSARVVHSGNINSLKQELALLADEKEDLQNKLKLNENRKKFVQQSIANNLFSLKHFDYYKAAQWMPSILCTQWPDYVGPSAEKIQQLWLFLKKVKVLNFPFYKPFTRTVYYMA